jgi:hypothetical protein
MTRSHFAFADQTDTRAGGLHSFRKRLDPCSGIILPVCNNPELLDFLRFASE